jgi:intraflagellar transport protein 88
MHNIALVFIKMGQWEEAISSLEYIMSEQACHRAGLHLIICCRALDDRDRMKTAFSMLLNVPMDVEDEEKYNIEQVIAIQMSLPLTTSKSRTILKIF